MKFMFQWRFFKLAKKWNSCFFRFLSLKKLNSSFPRWNVLDDLSGISIFCIRKMTVNFFARKKSTEILFSLRLILPKISMVLRKKTLCVPHTISKGCFSSDKGFVCDIHFKQKNRVVTKKRDLRIWSEKYRMNFYTIFYYWQ